jgi:DNA polymerase-3 subunit gamma/tau
MELYKRNRPKRFETVIGQPRACAAVVKMIEKGTVPHTMLFCGPSGVGKTTMARILATKLECGKHDLCEVNCADFRGIDTVRSIRNRMLQAPISGSSRVWIIDECHKLSNDAQNAFLKLLEDTPKHVYFFLCTTEPNKLLTTVRTRCTDIVLKSIDTKEIVGLVQRTIDKESLDIEKEAIAKVAEMADGSARKALVLLHQISGIDKGEQLDTLLDVDVEKHAIDLARLLISPKCNWKDVGPTLKTMEDDPETVRHVVLGYARSVLLSGGPLTGRAYTMIVAFRDHFYDSHKAGLAAACYEVVYGDK